MRRVLALSALPVLIALVVPSGALACSCAARDEPLSLKGFDAAVTARLLDVERTDPQGFAATFTYRITRVWKGRHRYDLREGRKLEIESEVSGAACGLPTDRGRRYGLPLYRSRGQLESNSCVVVSPQEMRRAGMARGSQRRAGAASGCQAS